MKKITKGIGALALGILMAVPMMIGAMPAQAADHYTWTREYNGHVVTNFWNMNQNFPMVRMIMNHNFFNNNSFLINRFNGVMPNDLFARNIVIVDRDDINSRIILNNSFTGPGSVNINRVVLSVNDDVFRNLRERIITNRDVNVNVNTGDNTISFNTIVGNIQTGDVSISIM